MKGDVQYCYFLAEVFLQHRVSKTRNKYKSLCYEQTIRFRIKNPAICGKLNYDCISDGLTEEDNKFLLALRSKAKMIKR